VKLPEIFEPKVAIVTAVGEPSDVGNRILVADIGVGVGVAIKATSDEVLRGAAREEKGKRITDKTKKDKARIGLL
jgi:hypothetical protein